MDNRKITPRMMGLGLILGMVFTAGGDISKDSSYTGKCGDSSNCCSYQESCATDSLYKYTPTGCCHKDSLTVDTMPKYFPKDTSKSICLPGDKTCD